MAKKLLTTPKGVAVWPRLSGEPDTKFDKAGAWKVSLKLEGPEATALAKEIQAAAKQMQADAKKENPKKNIKLADLPVKKDVDSEGNPTGALLFSFKMKASGTRKDGTKFTRQPALFDAKGQPILDVKIGGGSILRVSYEMSPFYVPALGAGVSLRLEAVQVIKLESYERNAAGYGFAEEEGGFEGDPTAVADATATTKAVAESQTAEDDDPSSADEF